MPVSLKDQSVLVVGASSGIGRDTAVLFAREGARVVCADRIEARARETAAMISEAGVMLKPSSRGTPFCLPCRRP